MTAMTDTTRVTELLEQLSGPKRAEHSEEAARLARDLFFASIDGVLSGEQEGELLELVEQLDDQVRLPIHDLDVCYHPSKSAKSLRFIDTSLIPEEHRALFTRPAGVMGHLSAVFVDPHELNFRNFENIIPIDRLARDRALGFEFQDHTALREDVHTFSVSASDDAVALLHQLDGLGLYQKPLSTNARGGLRCLLHSHALSEALTEAAKATLPAELLENFSHINPVFRCNRFMPGDAPFDAHVDAPYHDPNMGHVSRYTLIIYVTGGEAESVLDVDGVNLSKIEEMTAVVFHQSLEHSGAPFDEGAKIFLRTELVFDFAGEEMEHDPAIGALFTRATYMDRQSLFHPELSGYMQECYDRVSRAHWEGLSGKAKKDALYLHKRYRGLHFMANGHDYWFSDEVALEECALIAALDYFNGYFSGARTSFNKVCKSKVVKDRPGVTWIPDYLRDQESRASVEEARFPKESLCPDYQAQSSAYGYIPYSYTYEAFGESYEDTEPINVSFETAYANSDVRYAMGDAIQYVKRRVLPAPFLMVGKEVFIDPERVTVHEDKIYITSDEKLEPVNFASDVWNEDKCYPGHFIGIDTVVDAAYLLLPPIIWRHVDGCYHLMLDLFQNDWMVSRSEGPVHLPKIIERRTRRKNITDYSMPWYDATEPHADRKDKRRNFTST